MITSRNRKSASVLLTFAVAFALIFPPLPLVRAADHAESTSVVLDVGADLGDTFAFLSPDDNSRVVLVLTFHGFMPTTQSTNSGFFSPDILYRWEIENTGDAAVDDRIDVTFSPQTSRTVAQTATIRVPGEGGRSGRGRVFTAPTTVPNLATGAAPPFVVTHNADTDVKFFAGLADDPFVFDSVSFGRVVNSILMGAPNLSFFNRQRDTFAGYNIHYLAIEVPVAMLLGSNGSEVGINGVTLRRRNTHRTNVAGGLITSGDYVQVDRAGIPAVNTALIPFPRKNEFNAGTGIDDANGVFANSIVATLTALGTNSTFIGILANVAVVRGDFLRLNTAIPNTNLGEGQTVLSPDYTGFPNGRRPGDDTIDTLLYLITNTALTTGDGVGANERPLHQDFPFVGPPYQPFPAGTIDDFTRN